ncbi:unnamed protein product [Clonostachys byssicola]|uniref:non-specific serine/threonine protein kinase n=1 Tax=Clonostachys byssicola TaxID=160290 RepID=A0A9N9Y846_9HYPO|nr:unnamed protein product [Clonostachys byssicola]
MSHRGSVDVPGIDLFYLAPANLEAIKVVTSPVNSEFRASQTAEEEIGTAALSVGLIPSAKGGRTIVTLGRKGDITVEDEGEDISDVHCSFKINPETGVVMLHDKSDNDTTHVRGHNFRERGSRKVAMTPGKYELFKIGRHRKIEFKLVWFGDVKDALVRGKVLFAIRNPDARADSRSSVKKISLYVKAGILGSGKCGIVHKAIDLDTGAVVALKTYKNNNRSDQIQKPLLSSFLKNEAENLAKLKHPNIAKFISASGLDEGRPEIFLRMEEGSLSSLIRETNRMREPSRSEERLEIGKSVMKQMLEALHYLDTKEIVHRDVKPQNILYSTRSNGRYRFVLADFGLSECTSRFTWSRLSAGAMIFSAPETFEYFVTLTPKVDVWSLYVTMLVVLDVDGFDKDRLKCNNRHQIHDLVRKIRSRRHSLIEPFRKMASKKPEKRVSARHILKQWPAITWPCVTEEATLSDGTESDSTGSFYTAYKGHGSHGSDGSVSDQTVSDTSTEAPRSRRNSMPATFPESVRQLQMEFFRKYQVVDSDCDTWSETEESKTPRWHTVKSFGAAVFGGPRRTVDPRGVPNRLSCNLQAVVFDELFRDE